jgi:hypothetical protein
MDRHGIKLQFVEYIGPAGETTFSPHSTLQWIRMCWTFLESSVPVFRAELTWDLKNSLIQVLIADGAGFETLDTKRREDLARTTTEEDRDKKVEKFAIVTQNTHDLIALIEGEEPPNITKFIPFYI